MNGSIPLAICLFTSSKGHFGVRTRYIETLDHLNKQIPLGQFAGRFANLKVPPTSAERNGGQDIAMNLTNRGFMVSYGYGDWAHGEQSHQTGYIGDIARTFSKPLVLAHQHCLFLEDDWLLHAYDRNLLRYVAKAIDILTYHPDILTVRFPRFANERERILGLRAKHGIDGRASEMKDGWFACNDFSLNPIIARTRDLKIASDLFTRGGHNLPQHVEHGFGVALKHLSRSEMPLAVLDPATVKAAHIGTKPGEEDGLEPLMAT